jgi:hypothetical protein
MQVIVLATCMIFFSAQYGHEQRGVSAVGSIGKVCEFCLLFSMDIRERRLCRS